jgi:hypothetical protein
VTVPVIVFPNPLRMALDLLRAHESLPAALTVPLPNGILGQRICIRLPDQFPAGCPYLQVALITGGARLVPLRTAQAKIDLNIYHPDLFTCSDLAAQVTAIAMSLEQRRTAEGGFSRVQLGGDPFPLQDPDTAVERYIIPLTMTYRPS